MKLYSNLSEGDCLYRTKGIFEHVGVYLGNGKVFHCAPERGCEVVSYADFANGQNIKVKRASSGFKIDRRRLNDLINNPSKYNCFINNCEQAAAFLLTGKSHSSQLQQSIVGATFGFTVAKMSGKHGYGEMILGALLGLFVANAARKYDANILRLTLKGPTY